MKRCKFKNVRFTYEEFNCLEERAKKCGRTMSNYIRETSLGKTLHERPSEEFMNELRMLNKMGINLNQIATKVNTYNYLDEKQLKSIINELDGFIKELRKKYIGSG